MGRCPHPGSVNVFARSLDVRILDPLATLAKRESQTWPYTKTSPKRRVNLIADFLA